ncbi:MAG: glycosyltransferase, partial [Bacteroidota bacterium]
MSKPHLLQLCSWYPNRIHPTNGNFVEKHVRLLADLYQLTVLQVEYDPGLAPGKSEWTQETYTYGTGSYQVWTVYFGSIFGKSIRLLRRLQYFNQAFKIIERERGQIALVHVHVAMPAVFLASYWNIRWGIPFLLTCHSSGFLSINPSAFPWLQRRLLTWAANRAQQILPVSTALASAWQKDGLSSSITIIPNVVGPAFQLPAVAIKTSTFRLLHISNFAREAKNVDGLLCAVRRLATSGFPLHLTIAGDGDVAHVKALAARVELSQEHFTLLGLQSEAEVAQLMQTHNCFVLFSNFETQGVTLLEAQCTGLPVVATEVGGVPEIIDHPGKGILVEPGNKEQLIQAIRQAKDQSWNHAWIAQQAQARYSETAIRRALLTIIKKAMKMGAQGYISKATGLHVIDQAIRSVHSGEKYMGNAITEVIMADFQKEKKAKPLSAPIPTLTKREKEVLDL